MLLGADVPSIAYGGAGLAGVIGAGYFLMRVARFQSKTMSELVDATTKRVDKLEAENRELRISQRWCDHRLAEAMRCISGLDGIQVPAAFYAETPPERDWPHITKGTP